MRTARSSSRLGGYPNSTPPLGAGTLPGPDPPEQVPPLWTETLTHATENITLPETSFAGGNK